MDVKAAAIQVLQQAGTPLHAKDIAEQIMAGGLRQSEGKTPDATVSARFYSHVKSKGDKSPFVKGVAFWGEWINMKLLNFISSVQNECTNVRKALRKVIYMKYQLKDKDQFNNAFWTIFIKHKMNRSGEK